MPTLAVAAAAAVAAEAHHAAAQQQAERYRAGALQRQQAEQAAEAARAEAERRSQLPILIDAAPAPAAADPGIVTVARQQQPLADPVADRKSVSVADLPRDGAAPAPVAADVQDRFLASLRETDPEGLADYEQRYKVADELPYYSWFLGNFVPAHLRRLIPDVAGALELGAALGRWHYHAPTATTSTDMKGQSHMGETLSRADAERRFAELTSRLHDARSRNDYLAVRSLDAERHALAEALYPGSTEPDAQHRRTV